jgi:hypothetical protein
MIRPARAGPPGAGGGSSYFIRDLNSLTAAFSAPQVRSVSPLRCSQESSAAALISFSFLSLLAQIGDLLLVPRFQLRLGKARLHLEFIDIRAPVVELLLHLLDILIFL